MNIYLDFEDGIEDVNIVLDNMPGMAYTDFKEGTYDRAMLKSTNVTLDIWGTARLYFPEACLEVIQ